MERVPDWMQSVTVEFVCNNCPKRSLKNIAFLNVESIIAPVSAKAPADLEEIDEPEDAEV